MADIISQTQRSALMARIRGKDSKPEMALRRLLTGMGYRYRLHGRGLPGRPDVVFTARRAVVFVHGCFWHAHSCPSSRIPKTRPEFWRAKLEANTARDARQLAELEQAGWRTLVLWECEMKDLEAVGRSVADFLGPPKWSARGH